MADPAVLKNIKIKTGVLKRCVKDHACYIKETEKLTAKIEKMKAESQNDEDEYRAKKEEEVLQETRQMIGDSARRCSSALTDLKKALVEASLEDCQELIEANEAIASAAICTA